MCVCAGVFAEVVWLRNINNTAVSYIENHLMLNILQLVRSFDYSNDLFIQGLHVWMHFLFVHGA